MRKHGDIDYTADRRKVSRLYYDVLTGKMPVREALNKFPQDCEDKTVIASWHALCHYEADEEIRARDRLYMEEQDDYLEYIAQTLQKGQELPSNIIKEYSPYYGDALTANSKTLHGFFARFSKFLNI
ncbi:hypothetical protein II906_04230 [bacterium]|nr:hypothetical protein [bacterium]